MYVLLVEQVVVHVSTGNVMKCVKILIFSRNFYCLNVLIVQLNVVISLVEQIF